MRKNNNRRGLAILAGGLAFVGSASATDLIVNGSFESGVGVGWIGHFRTYNYTDLYFTGPPVPESEGPGLSYSWQHGVTDGDWTAPAYQIVDLTGGASAADIDANRGQFTFSAWLASYGQPGSNPEQPYLTLQFFDATGASQVGSTLALDRVTSAYFVQFADGVTTFDDLSHLHSWAKYVRAGIIPPGARTAKVGIQHSPNAGLSGTPDTYTDLVKLDVVASETRPALESAFPTGTGAPASGLVNVLLRDGVIAVNINTLLFEFDGSPVTPDITQAGTVTTVRYDAGILAPNSSHTYSVVFTDTGTPPLTQTNNFSFTVGTYVTLPDSYARPSGSANTRGLTYRTVHAATAVPALENSIARARAQLDGRLIDPGTGLPYANAATPGPNLDGSYNIDTVVNFEGLGNSAGNFPGDQAFPGLAAGALDSFATEAIFHLDLPAGYYRFGVNSDDGFEVSAGLQPQDALAPKTVLGVFDGGRGAGDTTFDFLVTTSGVYTLRLIYEEGDGDASCEFYSVDLVTGQKILINDPASTNAIVSYRVLTGVPQPPYVRYVSPAAGATEVPLDTAVVADIWDQATAVVPGTVQMLFNGAPVTISPAKSGIVTSVSYQPPAPLDYGTSNSVELIFGDGTTLWTNRWYFTVRGLTQPPGITGQWDFNRGDLSATIGQALEYLGGTNGPTVAATQFGTTTSFGVADIGGQPAQVMRFAGALNNTLGYVMRHGAIANGSPTATKVNQWTLIIDLYTVDAGWLSFIQIDSPANANDGDLFLNPDGGIGITGNYQGSILPGEWHRIAFAIDAANTISKYIDGVKVADQTGWDGAGLDGRHGLLPTAILLGDQDGDGKLCYVNSVQVRNYKMRDREIAALGGPTAEGIPSVSGQWDFDDQSTFDSVLYSTVGADMTYAPDTEFSSFYEQVPIGAGLANVLHFLASQTTDAYIIVPGGVANGGGLRLNQYTLLMDVMYPEASQDSWRALWQTRTNNTDDASLFISPTDGVGISSDYVGSIQPTNWYRIGFTFDLTQNRLKRYINGALVGQMTLGEGVDGRWAVDGTALLFADNDGDTAEGYCNSIQFRPLVLTDEEMARLGGPTAAGIPLSLPAPLRITRITQNGPDVTLEWSGGNAPFQVQTNIALGTPDWGDAGAPTADRTATLPIAPGAVFIRVVGQ